MSWSILQTNVSHQTCVTRARINGEQSTLLYARFLYNNILIITITKGILCVSTYFYFLTYQTYKCLIWTIYFTPLTTKLLSMLLLLTTRLTYWAVQTINISHIMFLLPFKPCKTNARRCTSVCTAENRLLGLLSLFAAQGCEQSIIIHNHVVSATFVL